MGFYGNITNVTNTTFTFDKIYSNRKIMEQSAHNDGVYVGRYVLIEYGEKTYPRAYLHSNQFYFSPTMEEKSRIKYLSDTSNTDNYFENYFVKKDDIIFILDADLVQVFYKCIGKDDNDYAIFNVVDKPDEASTYFENYRIDIKEYGEGRGFDSTAWQKVYTNGIEKYVMVAELNSVVPTFDLTIDAPTHEPVKPHFDKDSTSVYYKLHV